MESNPYSPPKAAVADVAAVDDEARISDVPLYTPNQMALASFLGSVIAATWLAAANFRAVGQPHKARNTWFAGVGIFVVLLALTAFVSDRLNILLQLGTAVAVRMVAEPQFGWLLREHAKAGGEERSWWRAIGISLLCAAILFGVAVSLVIVYTAVFGESPI